MPRVKDPFYLVVFDPEDDDDLRVVSHPIEADDETHALEIALQEGMNVRTALNRQAIGDDGKLQVYVVGRSNRKNPSQFTLDRAERITGQQFTR